MLFIGLSEMMWCIIQTWLHAVLLNILSRKSGMKWLKTNLYKQPWHGRLCYCPFFCSGVVNKKRAHALGFLRKLSLSVTAFIKKWKKPEPSFFFLTFLHFSDIFSLFKVFSFESLFQNCGKAIDVFNLLLYMDIYLHYLLSLTNSVR